MAPLGAGEPPPPARYVRVRAVQRARGHTHAGSRPVRHQAAFLDGPGRWSRLLLGAEGPEAPAGRAPTDRPHRHSGFADVLLDPREPLRLPRRPQAPTRQLAPGWPGRPPTARAVLRSAGGARRASRTAGGWGGFGPGCLGPRAARRRGG